MSKRNLAEYKEGQATKSTADKNISLEQHRVQGLLDKSKTSLFRSLKVARGFERQKLGRRQKTARKENVGMDIARLEAETTALKVWKHHLRLLAWLTNKIQNLDLSKTAELHLYRTLTKIKSIASSGSLPSTILATLDTSRKPKDAATTNVQARLFNSVPVKTTLVKIIDDVRAVLKVSVRSKNRRKGRVEEDNGKKRVLLDAHDNPKSKLRERVPEQNWIGLQDPGDPGSEDDLGSNGSEGAYLKVSNSQVPESAEESTSAVDVQRHSDSDWSGSESSVELEAEGEDTQRDRSLSNEVLPANPVKPQGSSATAPRSTIFLPTLSLGGYWSGSEDGSEIDTTAGKVEARRNKRGQRARRAIHEKKYGPNANHLKKQVQSRDHGWDLRKGAQGNGTRLKGRNGKRGFDRAKMHNVRSKGALRSSGANSDPVKPRTKAEPVAAGPLHPSWEAAKKAKESKQSAPFQGKKITFD